MPAMYTYEVTQTRKILVTAASPSDAAEAARYIFIGEPLPRGRQGFASIVPMIKVTRLEVEEV